MQEYYGLDLGDMYRGVLNPYRVWRLIEKLPPGSRTYQAVGGARATWSTTEYMLANVVDALNAANWQRAGKGPRPKPVKRPEGASGHSYGTKKPVATQQQILDYLHSLKE